MQNNSMLVCSFYLKKRFSHEEEKLYELNSTYSTVSDDGNAKSFSDVFEMIVSFCMSHSDILDVPEKQKLFSIQNKTVKFDDTATYRALSFIVQSGSYGVEADMTDRITKKVKYHRNVDEADVKKFACVVYVPKDTNNVIVNKGIMIFQAISTYGIKTITVQQMKEFFSEIDLTLETRSVSVSTFIEKLIDQGDLYKFTLIKNKLSPSYADNIMQSTGREEKTYIRPIMNEHAKKKILATFKKAEETGIREISNDFDCDDISLTFRLENKFRTVRLKNLDKLSIVEDIPDDVAFDNDYNKIIDYMIETAYDYQPKMVFAIGS